LKKFRQNFGEINMNWEDIIKRPDYTKSKKDISIGLSALKQALTSGEMLERKRHMEEFDAFDRYYFDLKNGRLGDVRVGLIQFDTISRDNLNEQVVDAVKNLRDEDLRDWSQEELSSGKMLYNTVYSMDYGYSILITFIV
tara:strand:- start:722 stop:1141 length:420 start_codon:yes stop_codon:yes gene_type:complete